MSRVAAPRAKPPPSLSTRAAPSRAVHPRSWSPATTSMVAKACELLGQLLLVVLLASVLGPVDYGTFALAWTLVTVFSSSLSVGGPTLASRLLSDTPREQRALTARRLARRLAGWRILQAVSLTALLAILVIVDPARFPPLLCSLGAIALILDLGATLLFQIGLGLGRVWMFSFRFPVQNAAVVAGVLVLYPLLGMPGAIAAIVVSAAAALLWGILTVGRTLAEPAIEDDATPEIPRSIWRFGLYQALGGLLVTLVYRGGIVATALLADSRREQGFAALAVGVGIAATFIVWQAFVVNLPRLVELNRTAARAAEAQFVQLARRALVLSSGLAIAGALLVRPTLPLVLGSGFRGGEGAMFVGLALIPLAAPTDLLSQVAALRLVTRRLLLTRALGAVTFVAVSVAEIPRWGALGALVAVLAGMVATLLTTAGWVAVPGARKLIAAALSASAVVLLIGLLT